MYIRFTTKKGDNTMEPFFIFLAGIVIYCTVLTVQDFTRKEKIVVNRFVKYNKPVDTKVFQIS